MVAGWGYEDLLGHHGTEVVGGEPTQEPDSSAGADLAPDCARAAIYVVLFAARHYQSQLAVETGSASSGNIGAGQWNGESQLPQNKSRDVEWRSVLPPAFSTAHDGRISLTIEGKRSVI